MKKERLSLNAIKNVLSRAELKKIMAGGSGGGGSTGGGGCPDGTAVWECSSPGYGSWTTAWCCPGTPNTGYVVPTTCYIIGYTPSMQAQPC
ncbi:MAG: hypothetical protein JWQ84_1053 [Mucilaginibacter sp.]|jgi:hypothetical protein|nr:hypothetical protein [Mucilaginibacter sp.]MDB5141216.1 hypothetical protein [Mucilaginibacter sp.]